MNWFSVEDRLPEMVEKEWFSETVLGYGIDKHYYFCWLENNKRWWDDCEEVFITHWQPLPNPPKEND